MNRHYFPFIRSIQSPLITKEDANPVSCLKNSLQRGGRPDAPWLLSIPVLQHSKARPLNVVVVLSLVLTPIETREWSRKYHSFLQHSTIKVNPRV